MYSVWLGLEQVALVSVFLLLLLSVLLLLHPLLCSVLLLLLLLLQGVQQRGDNFVESFLDGAAI